MAGKYPSKNQKPFLESTKNFENVGQIPTKGPGKTNDKGWEMQIKRNKGEDQSV